MNDILYFLTLVSRTQLMCPSASHCACAGDHGNHTNAIADWSRAPEHSEQLNSGGVGLYGMNFVKEDGTPNMPELTWHYG